MSFHEVQFPARLSLGSGGGPERLTEVVTLANGFEERATPWAHSRRRYDAGVAMQSLDDLAELIAFFEARRGRLHGFRWKDWADHRSCAPSAMPRHDDQAIGAGDGERVAFDLVKTYAPGVHGYVRPIRKPVPGTVSVAVGGTVLAEGAGFTLNAQTGVVTLAEAPAPGAEVTAGFVFDVPVRFDTDRLAVSVSAFQAGEVPDVPVVELRA
jgi:uncharacterized protein (TIGR02217 family)